MQAAAGLTKGKDRLKNRLSIIEVEKNNLAITDINESAARYMVKFFWVFDIMYLWLLA